MRPIRSMPSTGFASTSRSIASAPIWMSKPGSTGPRFADARVCGAWNILACGIASRLITSRLRSHSHGVQSSVTTGACTSSPSRSWTRTSCNCARPYSDPSIRPTVKRKPLLVRIAPMRSATQR
jgi:hypothetical protein